MCPCWLPREFCGGVGVSDRWLGTREACRLKADSPPARGRAVHPPWTGGGIYSTSPSLPSSTGPPFTSVPSSIPSTPSVILSKLCSSSHLPDGAGVSNPPVSLIGVTLWVRDCLERLRVRVADGRGVGAGST